MIGFIVGVFFFFLLWNLLGDGPSMDWVDDDRDDEAPL